MKALCWHGKGDVRIESVPDPKIEDPRDAVIRVTSTAICGSDLQLFDGYMPTMESGDILGHEFIGEVVEVGSAIRGALSVGDRVVVPFCIACGDCWFCKRGLTSCCDRSNRNAPIAIKALGHSPSGLFGFSHMLGAGRVFAIDCIPERLAMARALGRAETIDFSEDGDSVYDRLQEMTNGRGPDRCIKVVLQPGRTTAPHQQIASTAVPA